MAETAPSSNNKLISFGKKAQRERPRENEFMPYKSQAQERYFNANRDKLEGEGVNVEEWNQSSKGKKLPKRIGKMVKRGRISDKQHSKLADKWGKDDDDKINASSR